MQKKSLSFWANVPIPEAFVVGLVLGRACHALAPRRIVAPRRPLGAAGLALLLAGVLVITWAMVAARKIRIDRPTGLVTEGPYAISRNPMYLGWALGSAGIALRANSLWLLVAVVAAGLYIHLVEIPREEETLLDYFGEEYRAYERHTRRYL